MVFVLKYWKQLSVALLALVILTLMGTIYLKNQTIEQMGSTIKVKEAELALSNSSIYSLQREVEMQNQLLTDFTAAQQLKQKQTKAQLLQLEAEKTHLQFKVANILAIPETGNECEDVLSLLDTIGE